VLDSVLQSFSVFGIVSLKRKELSTSCTSVLNYLNFPVSNASTCGLAYIVLRNKSKNPFYKCFIKAAYDQIFLKGFFYL
jgi:hypothetical protein